MSKMSTTFRSVSYGTCSRSGVTRVASDFGGIICNCQRNHNVVVVKTVCSGFAVVFIVVKLMYTYL